MSDIVTSYIHPCLRLARAPGKGGGVFSKMVLDPGELVGIVGGGKIYSREEMRALKGTWGDYFHQVEDNFHWGPLDKDDIDMLDRFNHSCNPNLVIVGNMSFYVLKRISPDEECTWDYATTESEPDYGFDCRCNSRLCRKQISGNDWLIPAIQERYPLRNFAPYLQRRIRKMRGGAT